MKAIRISLITLLLSGSVLAQNQAPHMCGAGPGPNEVMAGMQSGGNGVAPTPLCYWKSESQQLAAGPQWETRWGAIATDSRTASLGSVAGLSSERKARREAMEDCKNNGGKHCVIEMAYYNQCAVMVVGDNGYNTASAATTQEATAVGMKTCSNNDGNCRVYHSSCSPPEQMR